MQASAQIDIPTWNLVVGVFIPLVVSLITKKISSQGLKAVINFGLSALSGATGAIVANNGHIPDLKAFVYGIAMTWGSSILSYYGLHKPTGIADTVAEKTKNVGFGSPPAPKMETEDKGAIEEGEKVAEVLSEQGTTATPAIKELDDAVGENGTVTFATTGEHGPGTLPEPPTHKSEFE